MKPYLFGAYPVLLSLPRMVRKEQAQRLLKKPLTGSVAGW